MENKKQERFELLSGIALGALVGIIIGMSVSHIVGIVLGALTSLLAAFFGLVEVKNTDPDKPSKFKSNPRLIFSFSFFAVLFILLGVYIRTHDSLGVSLEEQKKELKEIGLDSSAISKVLLATRYNLIINNSVHSIAKTPAGGSGDSQIIPMSETPIAEGGHSTLYSVEMDSVLANKSLKTERFSINVLGKLFEEPRPLQQFYNTVTLYVKDTLQQKDILVSTINLMRNDK